MGWLRIKLSMISMLIPPLAMTIGSSYSLHYLNCYYHHLQTGLSPSTVVIASSKSISKTILFAAITTIAGFASFFVADIKSTVIVGIFIIFSIILTLFFTFFLLSDLLSRMPLPKQTSTKHQNTDIFYKLLSFTFNLTLKLKYLWILIYFIVIMIFISLVSHLEFETSTANFFKKNDNVRKSLQIIQQNFRGAMHYNITLRPLNDKYFFKSYEGLIAAKKIQDYIDTNVIINNFSTIGWSISPVTLSTDLYNTLGGKNGIPEENYFKRLLNLLIVTSKRDKNIKTIINNDISAINFQVRVYSSDDKNANILSENDLMILEKKLKKELGEIALNDGRFSVEIWGELLLTTRITEYLIKDQVKSLLFTLFFVIIITLILFKSVSYGIISLIPLSFAVMTNFIIMSLFKIPIDAITVTIAAISIGIGIDDSIHFIIEYKKSLNECRNVKSALKIAFNKTSRPILFTSIALVFGFMVFALSSFVPVIFFGVLIAISMTTCTFATLLILPSFISLNK